MPTHRTTNALQFQRLVQLMKKHIDLARGVYTNVPGETNKRWNVIASELNSLGPPTRNGHQWQKVWIDTKGRVKKILRLNKAELKSTKSDIKNVKQLTPLQREIDELLSLSRLVNASEDSLDTDHTTMEDVKPQPTDPEVLDELINGTRQSFEPIEITTVDPLQFFQTTHQPQGDSKTLEKRFALLKKQTQIQEETLQRFTQIQENTCEIAKSLHKLVDAQERRNQILEAELELKRRKLELKEKELIRNVSQSY
uniref:Regulatory protein zeste n=1 Tax=Anopheles darlingi TaxID=43151 RepID=A0A2M4CZW2_ANODA